MEIDPKTGYSEDALHDMAYANENRRVAQRDFRLIFSGISALWFFLNDKTPHADFIATFILIYAAAIFIGRLITARY